ncbi:MAG: acyl carrier protein [Acidimicrobiales bacterium]|jgi:acyl carrier protein
MKTEEQITRFIESELLEGAAPNGDPLARGLLDSLAIEFLIGWVEEEFQISFSFRDVVAENFASIGALAALVDTKRLGGPQVGHENVR